MTPASISVERVIEDILRREGWPRYTDNPLDKGGPTKGGVTLRTLADYRGRPVTVEELQALTLTEAKLLYAEVFVVRPGFLKIDDPFLRAHLVDCAVLHGPDRAVRLLQGALGLRTPTGKFGIWTETAVRQDTAAAINARLFDARVLLLADIIERDHTQATFAIGWYRRALEFKAWKPLQGAPA